MTSRIENGVKIITLQETHKEERHRDSEAMTMFRLWSLITDDTSTRDLTVGARKIL